MSVWYCRADYIYITTVAYIIILLGQNYTRINRQWLKHRNVHISWEAQYVYYDVSKCSARGFVLQFAADWVTGQYTTNLSGLGKDIPGYKEQLTQTLFTTTYWDVAWWNYEELYLSAGMLCEHKMWIIPALIFLLKFHTFRMWRKSTFRPNDWTPYIKRSHCLLQECDMSIAIASGSIFWWQYG